MTFHKIFIATSILFCAGFAVLELLRFFRDGEPGFLLLACASAVAAAALSFYFRALLRKKTDGRSS